MAQANELSPRIGPKTDRKFTRTYETNWEVIADAPSWSGAQVLAFVGINLFSTHPEDTQARCINFDPRQDVDDPQYWTIRYDWSTAIEVDQDGQPLSQQHPLERKARIRIMTRKYSQAVTHTAQGAFIRNRALDPLEHTVERARTAIHIQRNLPFGDAFGGMQPLEDLIIENYVGATNTTAFLGRQPQEVLLDDFDTELKSEQGVTFWECNALFIINKIKIQQVGNPPQEIKTGGWVIRKLNAGYRELVSGKWVPILDQYGQRPARPCLLDDSGRKLDPGTPGSPASPIWLEFFDFEADLNQLGLLV